jgi:hypothetical protein
LTSQTFLSLVEEADARVIHQSDLGWIVETGGSPTRRYAFRSEDMPHNTARDVIGVLREGRPVRVMKQMTRCVGYYSMLHNMNRSKLAEIRDRHKGNYQFGPFRP